MIITAGERAQIIEEHSRGMAFEEDFALPGLSRVVVMSSHYLPGQIATPECTRGMFYNLREYGLHVPQSVIDTEPEARYHRGNALLNDPNVRLELMAPAASLTRRVGSIAITRAAVERVVTLNEEVAAGDRTDLRMAFFTDRLTIPTGVLRNAGSYVITESQEHGTRVWIQDGEILVDQDSGIADDISLLTKRVLAYPDIDYPTSALAWWSQHGQDIRREPRTPECEPAVAPDTATNPA